MKKHNPENERIKRKYFTFLKEAKRQNEASIDAVAKAISRFEDYTKYRDFKAFHHQQAIGFKKFLSKQGNKQTGGKLSKSTLHSTMRHLKAFFQWLAMQPGYKSRLNYSDMEYFNLSEKDSRIAKAKRIKPIPTIEQISYVLEKMPNKTDLEHRDRALISFTILTGARDSAIASIKLKHVDLINGSIFQDAREVNTKFSKTFVTYFFPVGARFREEFDSWVRYLKEELLWGNDDPLFPKTNVILGDSNSFRADGFKREHWATATPIREIFRKAFEAAGLPYFKPSQFPKYIGDLWPIYLPNP